MGKLVIFKLGEGSFEQGFPVTLQIGDENARPSTEITGELPPDPEIPCYYRRWQSIYRSLDLRSRPIGLTRLTPAPTLEDCYKEAEQLKVRLNTWLQSESFRPVREKWLEKLMPSEHVRVLLQTKDVLLQKLPWHLWDLLERYPNAEIALSAATYEQVPRLSSPTATVKILAILGNSQGIDTQVDRAQLEQLADAEVTFLVEPKCKELTDHLWKQNWQIFFFAGHSSSAGTGETGQIYINQTEILTISQLKYALKKAVAQGLKLAIFNSCDGLGLAREFADLQIPQLIVMREPVPDRVAQEFLKSFLAAFARGDSLYLAVREARERLQGLEKQFPCATWLPVICQNPAEMPLTWQELTGHLYRGAVDNKAHAQSLVETTPVGDAAQLLDRQGVKNKSAFGVFLLVSVAITALVMGVRYLGVLQPLELRAFDQLLRLRPDEQPDSRLLIVTVTEEDVQAQSQEQRRGSLSDQSLNKLLDKLEVYQPLMIGLDIYRDYAVAKNYPVLANRLRQSDRLVSICKVSDPEAEKDKVGISPPPEVPQKGLGFSDIVLDSDKIVRRHLLALTPSPSSPCLADYAFNVQLTLRYLASRGISLQFTKEGSWQLGKTIIKPLEAHTGGYQNMDAWGHQILLNYRSYRSPQDFAPHITLKEVLAGQLYPSAVKDKIVLIGTTAESFRDYSLTPYMTSQDTVQEIPGVMLQAQMVSQLLSAVLDGRPLLWTWSFWGEVIWVWEWSLVGGFFAWYLRRPAYLYLAGGVAIASLYGICLVALIQVAGWLPFIPSALALLSSMFCFKLYMTSSLRSKG
ncbi:MAG: CHASE2 domain-containing protein [Stigonema ocellatum SAG 48.90 = DSM 106950]|nr:CHASE2 domain-containing protein [Stigonema ocellatum SAG 48.90 = DSM 106950]